jgi:hypothetical protein
LDGLLGKKRKWERKRKREDTVGSFAGKENSERPEKWNWVEERRKRCGGGRAIQRLRNLSDSIEFGPWLVNLAIDQRNSKGLELMLSGSRISTTWHTH